MRMLIVTQAVDLDDPVLGFFHGWIAAFSKHCKSVHVICLKEERHSLPANVRVHSLGKESGQSRVSSFQGLPSDSEGSPWIVRIQYILRFYQYIWSLRNEYDVVFVHMNQEYVLLGGKFWRLFGKRVVLWRNHKMGSVWTHVAGFFAHTVCYTSPSAYVTSFKNAVRMPIGIDTNFFKPSAVPAAKGTILFLGRLDAVKKPDIFLRAMEILVRENGSIHADIYGDTTPGHGDFARRLKAGFISLKQVTFHPAVSNEKTPSIYNAHSIYLNLTPSGSFDKTIGEAMATGCIVVACNDAVKGVLPKELFVTECSAEFVAAALHSAFALSESERTAVTERCRAYIEHEHSLLLLSERLFDVLRG